MGRKTVRCWERVDCPWCRGSGWMWKFFVKFPSQSQPPHRVECEVCKGSGKINKKLDVKT